MGWATGAIGRATGAAAGAGDGAELEELLVPDLFAAPPLLVAEPPMTPDLLGDGLMPLCDGDPPLTPDLPVEPIPLFEPVPPVTPDLPGEGWMPLFDGDPPLTPDLLVEPIPLFEPLPPVTPDRLADEPVTLDLLPAPDWPGDGGIKSSSKTEALGISSSV